MTTGMFWLVALSLAALLAISTYRFAQERNAPAFGIQLAALAVLGFILFSLFFPSATAKSGDEVQWAFVVVLYLFMILGMCGNYAYEHFSVPLEKRAEKEFDFGLFVAPVFVSPIIFVPLFAAFMEELQDPQMTHAKVMVFLVAFENGFFWKAYFDNKRKEVKRANKPKRREPKKDAKKP